MKSDEITAESAGETYRYRNVGSLSTFGFAALAALGALGIVAAAQGALAKATQDEVIANPPDLRQVLVAVEKRAGVDIPGTPNDAAAEQDENPQLTLSAGEQHVRAE